MAVELTLTGERCAWLVERLVPWHDDPDWYPDFPGDAYQIVECGEPVDAEARHPLCGFHAGAMAMDEREFEALSEAHGGHAFS